MLQTISRYIQLYKNTPVMTGIWVTLFVFLFVSIGALIHLSMDNPNHKKRRPERHRNNRKTGLYRTRGITPWALHCGAVTVTGIAGIIASLILRFGVVSFDNEAALWLLYPSIMVFTEGLIADIYLYKTE